MSTLQADILALENSFEKLSKHALRMLIQKSKGTPEDKPLRKLLLRRLWDHERFKDFYELLPTISSENLKKTLELHTKSLLRVAASESSSLKKLIPIALSYSNFLKPHEGQALLGLLDTLVQKKQNPQLTQYHSLLLGLMKRVDECLKEQGAAEIPELRLTPEIASKTNFCEKIHQYLTQANHVDAHYYLNGGHYLLSVQCGYFSDLDNRNRSLLDSDMNLCLEAIRAFVSLGKNLEAQLNPTYAALGKNSWAQLFISQWVCDKLNAFENQKATLDSKEIYRMSMEMLKYVELLIQNVPNVCVLLAATPIFCSCEILRTAPKVEVRIPLKALEVIDSLMNKADAKESFMLREVKAIVEQISIKRFIDQLDKQALSKVLFRKGPKSCEESSHRFFLECVDEFISHIDCEEIFHLFGNFQALLSGCDLLVTILESFGDQKKRINQLKKMERQWRRSESWG